MFYDGLLVQRLLLAQARPRNFVVAIATAIEEFFMLEEAAPESREVAPHHFLGGVDSRALHALLRELLSEDGVKEQPAEPGEELWQICGERRRQTRRRRPLSPFLPS